VAVIDLTGACAADGAATNVGFQQFVERDSEAGAIRAVQVVGKTASLDDLAYGVPKGKRTSKMGAKALPKQTLTVKTLTKRATRRIAMTLSAKVSGKRVHFNLRGGARELDDRLRGRRLRRRWSWRGSSGRRSQQR
jgi:hypothetical protein